MWTRRELTLEPRPRGFHLVTGEVVGSLPELREMRIGLLHLLIRHTSASLTLNENASPDVRRDFETWANEAVPERFAWTHTLEGPDDMPAHVKASLMGPSLTLPVGDGRLELGTWQGIYLCEHRDRGGPRSLTATLWGRVSDVHGPYAGLVARHGLAESHRLVLAAVPDGALVLDVGCATGYLAAELVGRGCTVIGAEADPQAAAQARAWCDEVVVGDLEASATREALGRAADGGVDVVLCADVLEHLRDPWAALAWLRTLLREDGLAVVSLPNIGHWTARRALVRGRFDYADHGLFDRTHLRFFTRDSASELARRAGFAVQREHPAGAPLPLESRVPALGRVRGRCVARCPALLALQFVLVLRPALHRP